MTILCGFHFRVSISTAGRLGSKLRVSRSQFCTRKYHPILKQSCCNHNWSCADLRDGVPRKKRLRERRTGISQAQPQQSYDSCPWLAQPTTALIWARQEAVSLPRLGANLSFAPARTAQSVSDSALQPAVDF